MKKVAEVIDIPFTVGGGVKSLQHARDILLNGADKVAINTAAIKNLTFVKDACKKFGSQCIVASLEVKKMSDFYEPWYDYGRENSGKILSNVSKKLDYLVTGEKPTAKKVKQANELSIKVISQLEWEKLLN